jgi:hypothetical protein
MCRPIRTYNAKRKFNGKRSSIIKVSVATCTNKDLEYCKHHCEWNEECTVRLDQDLINKKIEGVLVAVILLGLLYFIVRILV